MTAPRPWCTPRRRPSRPRSSSGCGGRSRCAGLDRRCSRRCSIVTAGMSWGRSRPSRAEAAGPCIRGPSRRWCCCSWPERRRCARWAWRAGRGARGPGGSLRPPARAAPLLAGGTLPAPRGRRRERGGAGTFRRPWALHLAASTAGPVLFAVYLSVHRFSPVEPARPFIGLAGYAQALASPQVWAALGRTLLYACYVPVTMGLALALALVVRGRSRGARMLRALFLLPAVSSVVAVALVWRWMYQPDAGVINHLLGHVLTRVGLRPVDWLGDPGMALIAVMIVSVWTQLGYQMAVL